jgi:sulfonate transport system substrate-binding protein
MKKLATIVTASLLLAALAATSLFAAEAKPSVIRIGTPAGAYSKPFTTGAIGTVHAKGVVEDEFRKDGIEIEWNFLKATGPGINEAFANNSLDFASIGDLPAIAGRSGGLKTRLVACSGRGGNTYVVVPDDSKVTSVKQLKGKRIGVNKGTYMHASFLKIIKDYGLSEKDLKIFNMDIPTQQTAIASKDIDAAFMTNAALDLRLRGVGRIIHSTRNDPSNYQQIGSILVNEQFAKKYPDITRRLVKAYVKGAILAARSKDESLKLWTKSGSPLASLKEDNEGKSIQYTTSPRLDEHFITYYRDSIRYFKEVGLIRQTFDLDKWIDRSYLDAAIKELKAEKVWPDYNVAGDPKK